MNTQKLRNIIALYKVHFSRIHKEEIYKWQAVKQFQDNWNADAPDFQEMLKVSLSKSKNLMDSGNYFPRRMMNFFTLKDPERVRVAFKLLFDEDQDLVDRIENFKETMEAINMEFEIKKNDYQDLRAVVVYLCLRYPERYYFYKYEMVRDFVLLVDYPVKPIMGRTNNILEFLTMCNIIKAELMRDPEVLELHKTRIGKTEYHDSAFNVLTQDVIYASVKHIANFEQHEAQYAATSRLEQVEKEISPEHEEISFKGTFTNYLENEKENKRIGDLGELLVLQYEKEKLSELKIKKKPVHVSKTMGDGLGYDILSYDEKGKEMYIEVKTTVGNSKKPFYVTRHELERSKVDEARFYLYRLYYFDDVNNKAKYYVRKGSLASLCVNPVLYRVLVNH